MQYVCEIRLPPPPPQEQSPSPKLHHGWSLLHEKVLRFKVKTTDHMDTTMDGWIVSNIWVDNYNLRLPAVPIYPVNRYN